jgi:hypothetical protein
MPMFKGGIIDYFSDTGNYIDLIYIWGSIGMGVVHGLPSYGPYTGLSKGLMCLTALLAIRRTFNYLRVFAFLSPIVTMLSNVIWSLRIFLTFYFMLCLLLSLMLGVLGVQNPAIHGDFRNTFWIKDDNTDEYYLNPSAPGYEYRKIGLLLGNFITIMRISMGDFAVIAAVEYLHEIENMMFWIIWTLAVIIQCIIFMNFIVAEAGNSYNEVSEQLENVI